MGHFIWIMVSAAAVGGLIGLTSLSHQEPERADATISEHIPADTAGTQIDAVEIGTRGSALAVAAFGLSALQPETYNGELVMEIIDASHLDKAEKEELAADLEAAEMGRADLDDVLEDVRIALAVE